MRKVLLVPCMALALALTACQATVEGSIEKLSNFVDQVEEKSAEYTEKDWKKANKRFEELVNKLEEFEDITPEQTKEIIRQQGRYTGIAVKNKAGELIDNVSKGIDGFLEGLGEEKR